MTFAFVKISVYLSALAQKQFPISFVSTAARCVSEGAEIVLGSSAFDTRRCEISLSAALSIFAEWSKATRPIRDGMWNALKRFCL